METAELTLFIINDEEIYAQTKEEAEEKYTAVRSQE